MFLQGSRAALAVIHVLCDEQLDGRMLAGCKLVAAAVMPMVLKRMRHRNTSNGYKALSQATEYFLTAMMDR